MRACHEASFAWAHCRLDVEIKASGGGANYIVTMFVVDPAGPVRPIVYHDGRRAERQGCSELSAVSAAVSYLESVFGAFCEIAYNCEPYVLAAPIGPPYVIRTTAPAELH